MMDLTVSDKIFLYEEIGRNFFFFFFFCFCFCLLHTTLSFLSTMASLWPFPQRHNTDDLATQAKVKVNKFNRITDEEEKRIVLGEIRDLAKSPFTHEEFGSVIPSLMSMLSGTADLGLAFLFVCLFIIHLFIYLFIC